VICRPVACVLSAVVLIGIAGARASAHGSREMPVWGFTFQTAGLGSEQERLVQEVIDNLSQYLESSQDESPSRSE
jgi:hypothetical protein